MTRILELLPGPPPLPTVHVSIGEGSPRAFVVDTAAAITVVTPQLVAEHGLESTGEVDEGVGAGGTMGQVSFVSVPHLCIGADLVCDTRAVVMDLSHISDGFSGILGFDLSAQV